MKTKDLKKKTQKTAKETSVKNITAPAKPASAKKLKPAGKTTPKKAVVKKSKPLKAKPVTKKPTPRKGSVGTVGKPGSKEKASEKRKKTAEMAGRKQPPKKTAAATAKKPATVIAKKITKVTHPSKQQKTTIKEMVAVKPPTPAEKPAKKSLRKVATKAPKAVTSEGKTVKPVNKTTGKPAAKPPRKVAAAPPKTVEASEKTAVAKKKTAKTLTSVRKTVTKKVVAKAVPKPAATSERKTAKKVVVKTPGKAPRKMSTTAPVKKQRPVAEKAVRVARESITLAGRAEPEVTKIKPRKTRLKIFLPVEDMPGEETIEVYYEELPEEYGENELFLMAVDPNIIYAGWEIREDDMPRETGMLNMRVFDVTGIDFDGFNARGFLDIVLDKRVGSGYFGIQMPGKEVLAEIGPLDNKGKFRAILRSNRVFVPPLLFFDELGIVEKLLESGFPVGY